MHSSTHQPFRLTPPRRALIALGLILPLANASAQDADTIEKIRKTHTITLGVRDISEPFSTLDSNGQAVGYSIDVCNKVVEVLKKDLKLGDLKVVQVPVTATNRFAKLKDGTIDMECGSTVNTRARQAEVAFSYSFFIGAEKLLSRTDAPINEIGDLAGKTVGVIKGSVAEKLMTQLKTGELPTMKLQQVANNNEAIKALDAGSIHAVAQMDVILEAARKKSKSPDRLMLSKSPLSVEPIGLPVRKDDQKFRAAVNNALSTIYSSGEIKGIYDHWFNAALKIPVSQMLRECLTRPNAEPGVALGLGYAL